MSVLFSRPARLVDGSREKKRKKPVVGGLASCNGRNKQVRRPASQKNSLYVAAGRESSNSFSRECLDHVCKALVVHVLKK